MWSLLQVWELYRLTVVYRASKNRCLCYEHRGINLFRLLCGDSHKAGALNPKPKLNLSPDLDPGPNFIHTSLQPEPSSLTLIPTPQP